MSKEARRLPKAGSGSHLRRGEPSCIGGEATAAGGTSEGNRPSRVSVKALRRIGLGGGPADERSGLHEPLGGTGVGEYGRRWARWEESARGPREAPPAGAWRERHAIERSSASVWWSQATRSRARRLGDDAGLVEAVNSFCCMVAQSTRQRSSFGCCMIID